jgi:conjugative transfer signal peptidase TraF
VLTKVMTNGSSETPEIANAGPLHQERIRRALITVFFLTGVLCALVAACALFGIRFNLTQSMPGFFYLITNDGSSPLIEFCPERAFAQLSTERGYRRPGTCPDGASSMLKPIVARAGDIVEVSANGIAVNGTLLRNTAPRTRDSRGLPLAHWPFGRYEVPPGFVWVASEYNALSFDSRYYGPIPVSHIRHHLRPL